MYRFRQQIIPFASAVFVLSFAPSSFAGPSYNCKPDKRLDVPMQFTATVESGGRVHLSASGGSDKSGWVAPYNNGAWRVFNASGQQVTRFTESLFLFASTDLLKESYVEGLLPGSYTVQLTSTDLCGNLGQARQSIVIPTPELETTLPVISTPQVVMLGGFMGGASSYALYFTATDNTGLKRISIEASGNPIAEFNYFNGTAYRWWTAFYPEDSTLTAFEGPSFYVSYPATYRGLCGVQVTGEDLSGNRFTATASICLP